MLIELFHRRNFMGKKRWYFRVKARNGLVIAQSEAYSRRVDALSTAGVLCREAGAARIVEVD